MKQSIFEKTIVVKGSWRTVTGKIVATLNNSTRKISGTHASSHDDYERVIPLHKVEVLIEGKSWTQCANIESENELYELSKHYINAAKEHCEKLANTEPERPFSEKMTDLFKSNIIG